MADNASDKQERPGRLTESVRRTVRTKRVIIRSVRELGALLRVARCRLNMSQSDAAVCCGVGRRFYVELENGKPSVRLDKVFDVLNALGLNLALGGPGTAFTVDELASASLKQDADEPEHVWEAEFVKGLDAPYTEDPAEKKPTRGRRTGSVAIRYRRKSGVNSEDGKIQFRPENDAAETGKASR
ncbi:MAG: hypothetical protein ACFWTZ_02510 [Burkholderia sp.]|jgi:transcriptional regulator with XRE-family HTH domain